MTTQATEMKVDATGRGPAWTIVSTVASYDEACKIRSEYVAKGFAEPGPEQSKQVKVHRCGEGGNAFAVKIRTV